MKKLSKRIVSMMLAAMMILSLCGHMAGKAEAVTPGYYQISFDMDGKTVTTSTKPKDIIEVKSGATYTIPKTPVPACTGYDFVGYYEKSDPSTVYEAGQILTPSLQRNYTLIAKWKKVQPGKYMISFKKGNTTGITYWPSDLYIASGAKYTLPTPKRTGYVCTGFRDQTQKFYHIGDVIQINGNLTMTPVWAKGHYATCTDEPIVVKNYRWNEPNSVNLGQKYDVGRETNFKVSGWVIHDRGIVSYSYVIKDKNGTNVKGRSGSVYTYGRKDLGEMGAALKRLGKITTTSYVQNTGFSETINIVGLGAGKYTVVVTGKTKDGDTFNVLNVGFEIKDRLVTVTAVGPYKEKKVTRSYGFQLDIDKDINPYIESEFGYHPSWRNSATEKEVSGKITVKENINLKYIAAPNEANVSFVVPGDCQKLPSNTPVILGRSVHTGQRFDEVVDTPIMDGYVFVGWGTNNGKFDDVSGTLYLPEHHFVYQKGSERSDPIVYEAKFIKKIDATTFTIKYRLNYKDMDVIEREYKKILNNAKTLSSNENKGNWASKIVKGATDIVIDLIDEVPGGKTVKKVGLKVYGWFFGEVVTEKTTSNEKAEYEKVLTEEINAFTSIHASWSTASDKEKNMKYVLASYDVSYSASFDAPHRGHMQKYNIDIIN